MGKKASNNPNDHASSDTTALKKRKMASEKIQKIKKEEDEEQQDDDDHNEEDEEEDDEEEEENQVVSLLPTQYPLTDDDDDDDDQEDSAYQSKGKRKASKKGNKNRKHTTDPDFLQVAFQFCDPAGDNDYARIRELLVQGTFGSLPSMNSSVSQFADQIVAQISVGTTVKVDDDDNDGDVYAFATILPGSKRFRTDHVRSLLMEMKKYAPEGSRGTFQEYFDHEKGCGVLITERVVNIPPQLAPHLHRILYDDLEWAKTKYDEAKVEKDVFKFEYIVVFAPCFLDDSSSSANAITTTTTTTNTTSRSSSSNNHNNNNNNSNNNNSNTSGFQSKKKSSTLPKVDYVCFEDKVYAGHSLLSFLCPLKQKEGREFQPSHVMVMVIPTSKISHIMEEALSMAANVLM